MTDYIDMDFDSFKEYLKSILKSSDSFKDYNFEGSNISMIIELMSYMMELNTYYQNRQIKNIYPDTAELYETMHSISSIRGYRPKGGVAPHLNLRVKVLVDDAEEFLPSPGEQLVVPAWFRIPSELSTDDGEDIQYITTKEYIIDIPEDFDNEEFEFTLPMKEGTFHRMQYTGEDIVNNKIIMPFYRFDHDKGPYDENPSIELRVNDEPWERVDEFRSDVLRREDKVYILEYDKYENYNILFSHAHRIPDESDRIQVIANITTGPDADISSNSISEFNIEREVPKINRDDITLESQRFLQNISRDVEIPEDYIEIGNPESSFNSSSPETIEEIRRNSMGGLYAQFRNVNSRDYRIHLAEHPDITVGNAWGEQEISPQNTESYNKVYISVVPREIDEDTMDHSTLTGNRETFDQSDTVIKPLTYNSNFEYVVLEHLGSRKALGIYEKMIIPEFVYFAFDIGLGIRRTYNFTKVREEIKKKLQYYFRAENREFNETIDFKRLHEYLMDETVRDDNNDKFWLTRGVKTLVFRDIETFTPSLSGDTYAPELSATYDPDTIFEPNENLYNPMYTEEDFSGMTYHNELRPIKLGLNQFPVLAIDNCTFTNEK